MAYKKTISSTADDNSRPQILNYEVKPGDTLSQIAARFNTDVRSIIYNNNLSSETIRPGQNLRILTVEGIIHWVNAEILFGVSAEFMELI